MGVYASEEYLEINITIIALRMRKDKTIIEKVADYINYKRNLKIGFCVFLPTNDVLY